ncbi:MAG: hypothetical protein IJ904_00935 [Candidatus Methanomethylophilaceae archaeon]|nr:hypothetical protein [Candidatus Methanomethylophilaceae archaeon]
MDILKAFNPGIMLKRAGQVFFVSEYDNTASVPVAVFVPFPDAASRNKRPEPWTVNIQEFNALLLSGDIAIAS